MPARPTRVGEKLADQHLDDRGIGGGAYLHLTIVSLSLDVAAVATPATRASTSGSA